MDHLSLFWDYPDREKHLKAIETEFFQRIYRTIKKGTFSLPPIPSVIIELQKICKDSNTRVNEVVHCLLDDVSLTALVVRTANSALLSPKGQTPCYDIHLAVSRLGIPKVLEIATAHAVKTLKQNATLEKDASLYQEGNALLETSAQLSREFASTMALLCKKLKGYDEDTDHLEVEKALLIGLLADIGIYSAIHTYKMYCDEGNYLDFDIARHVFWNVNKDTSHYILKNWNFDQDFIDVSCHRTLRPDDEKISYLDIATMANHLLMFRNEDENIHEHNIELTLAGAETMYELTNLEESDFRQQLLDVIDSCRF